VVSYQCIDPRFKVRHRYCIHLLSFALHCV
jgi:hypothetical protein